MGKPGRSHVLSPMPEHIGHEEGTWGSETSHEAIRVEDLRSLWAPNDESTKNRLSQSIHFRLFTEKRTIYLIVPTIEKMRYWIAGLKKLNPELELDVRPSIEPASPLSPRTISKLVDSVSFNDESFTTDDDTDEGWD